MSDARTWAMETARIIIDNDCLYTRTQGDPFFFSSGWASTVFIDCKKLISVPDARNALVRMALERISDTVTGCDAVAGYELTGVPFATLLANRLHLPLTVVYKQRKGFGRLAQFEGSFEPGTAFVLIDDLATDGMRGAVFEAALCRTEASIVGTFVLVDHAVFPKKRQLISLATLEDVIAAAEAANYLGDRELSEINRFIADAAQWSKQRGGITTL